MTKSKYILLYGKFGRHEDASGNAVSPSRGGELRIKRPGDIVELTPAEAHAKHDSVRLATDPEIAAYEERLRNPAAAAPEVPNQGAVPPTVAQTGPVGPQDGIRLADPSAPIPPAGKPAPLPVAPAAVAHAAPHAPAPAAPPAAAPAVPTAIPAVPAAPASAAPSEGKPKARSGNKKSGGKKGK